MTNAWPKKIAFWSAIIVSGVWFVLSIAIGIVVVRAFFFGILGQAHLYRFEIPLAAAFAVQPAAILFLIIRAIRARDRGPFWRIVGRALAPLIFILSIALGIGALEYLRDRANLERVMKWRTGTITYFCSSDFPFDKSLSRIGLRLREFRHPKSLSNWIVLWPGKKPVNAISFSARTGSYGGSEGIKWQRDDGRIAVAYISFSDVMGDYGPESLWVNVMEDSADNGAIPSYGMPSARFQCAPDPSSFRATY